MLSRLLSSSRSVSLSAVRNRRMRPFQRVYFCSSQDGSEPTEDSIRLELLEKSLEFIPDYGFSSSALQQAAEAVGYPQVTSNLIKNGAFDMWMHYHRKIDQRFVDEFKEHLSDESKKPNKAAAIRWALKRRLELNAPIVRPTVLSRSLLEVAGYPLEYPRAAEMVFRFADDVWYCLGDRDVDMSWYSKRLSLATVYANCFAFMHLVEGEDGGRDGFSRTWTLLDTQLKVVGILGVCWSKTSSVFSGLSSLTYASCSVVPSLLGVNKFL